MDVYRGLDADGRDKANLAAHAGLYSTQPGSNNTIESHIGGSTGMRSQWISASKSEEIARDRYGRYGVVRIDLDKVTTDWVDCSQGIPPPYPSNPTVDGYAILDLEVVVRDHISDEAITILVPPP